MICGGCNQDTRRVKITMTDRAGRLLPDELRKEICPSCSPEDFEGAHDPLATFIPEHIAHPHLYEQMPDGSLRLKDSPTADLMDEMLNNRDEDEAIAKKRRTRRTTPMTEAEIAAASVAMRPYVQAYLAEQARQEREDADYTKSMIDRLVQEENERERKPTVN